MRHTDLTADQLRSRLDYDAHSGVFTWRRSDSLPASWNTRWAGNMAGQRDSAGRGTVRINYTKYLTARLAWLYVTGTWPIDEIDHRDCDPGNDRFANLREATRTQNMRNTRLARRGTSGSKGVCFDRARGKWMAHIHHEGRFRNLGRFSTRDAAAQAYADAAHRLFGEFARVA